VSVWQDFPDQERVVARLRRAIERDRVPHAYLFSGPPGAPMYATAIALASALSCLRARGEGCDPGDADDPARCDACAKIAAGIHPDVVTLVREGAAQIVPIESVRNQVIARIGLPPHEGEVRVFIVEEATSMAPPAANALLKTLEEPPARTLFVLCTTAPEQLLPTIRSRCQRVRFGGGDAVASDADPARAERVSALGAELRPIGMIRRCRRGSPRPREMRRRCWSRRRGCCTSAPTPRRRAMIWSWRGGRPRARRRSCRGTSRSRSTTRTRPSRSTR